MRSAAKHLARGVAVVAALLPSACKKPMPPDTVCAYEALPAEAEASSGRGAVLVVASGDAYFAVRDGTGKQITNAHVNSMTAVTAGDYQLVLNNSTRSVSAQSKMLTRCKTGTVLVSGKTDEYYAVLDSTLRQLASARLGSALSLFPGTYQVRLNHTDAAANLQAGSTLELNPGTVNVETGTDEYYSVLDATARQLASSHVGRGLGLFAGNYIVRVNNSDTKADVRAGESTLVPGGALLVHGSTDEYYSVLNNAGAQLASAHLEKALGFIPGTYNVKVNGTTASASVIAGTTVEVKTGAVLLEGSTDEYYNLVDSAGMQLASAHLGKQLSFMPGAYRARLNNVAIAVQVEAGRTSNHQAGTLTVNTTGSDYYTVLDPSGTQLVSKQVNQAVSLPAGRYTVKLGNNTRPAAVIAGQAQVVNW
jgi:hypothetical protein